jgi:hypothetical protein
MRTTRAFIAGIGTTGSLVAAAAGVFVVASAVIAFNGWPGAGFADRIDSIFVNDEPPVAWDQPGTQAVATGAGTAAAAVAATPAGPTFGEPGIVLANDGTALRGGPVRLPDGAVVPGPPTGGGGGVLTPPGGDGPIVNPGDLQNQVAQTVQQTGRTVGGTVRDTTRGVGDTVGGPAGDAVTQTGNTVGNTVDQVTNTAGSLLGGK